MSSNSNNDDTITTTSSNSNSSSSNDNGRYRVVQLMHEYVNTGHEDKYYELYNAITNSDIKSTIIKKKDINTTNNNDSNTENNTKPDIASLFAQELEGIRKDPSFNNTNQLAYLQEIVMIDD